MLLKEFNIIVSLLLLFCTKNGFAQKERINSLIKVLPSLKDSARVDCLNGLSEAYIDVQIDTAEVLNFKARTEAEKIHYIHGMAEATSLNATIIFRKYDNYSEAERLAREAIELYEKTPNKKRLNRTYHELGHALYGQSYFDEAINNLNISYDLSQKAGDSKYVLECLIHLGYAYMEGGDYKEAFERVWDLHQLVLRYKNHNVTRLEWVLIVELYISIEDYIDALLYTRRIFQISSDREIRDGDFFNIAELFSRTQQFDSAKYYYSLIDTSNSERALRFYLVSIGEYYFLQGEYYKALPNLLRGLNYHRQANNRNQVMRTLIDLAKTYRALQSNDPACRYAHQALVMARQTGARQMIRDSYKILYSVYNDWKRTDSALHYHQEYVAVNDSITSDQLAAKLVAYNFEQKIDELNKEKKIKEIQLQKQSFVKNILLISILVLVLFAAIIFRNISLKRKNENQKLEHGLKLQQLESEIERQQTLLNERLRISRELHDDIGSTLGSISIYSEVAKNRTERNENANEVLFKIGLASREIIEKMSDIVWSLHPRNLSFEQLQNRMTTFAAMILVPRNIRYDFIADEKLKELQFTAEQLKGIFLIFKEALYNIVKYAHCKTVRISFSIQNDEFTMLIQDDGKGFDVCRVTNETSCATNSLGGNGIKNMNARANAINAKLYIKSNTSEGSQVQLVLNL